MKTTILITGGLGFIGSNLIKLISNKFNVKILDDLSNLPHLDKKKFEYEKNIIIGDIKNYDICKQAVRGVDIIVHLAARGNVVDSVNDPFDNYENNVLGTFNILKAATDYGVKKIIFASTGGALMGNCELPVSEDSVPKPIAPYGASKLAGEGYCHAFANISNSSITILRFANIYGTLSMHKKGLINAIMQKIYANKNIEIYGDGNATRDFLFVEDLCIGILKAIDYKHSNSEIFHLASAKEVSTLKVAQTLLKISGNTQVKIIFKEKRKGEVENNVASYSKANKMLDFQPSISLEDGLKRCWDWFTSEKSIGN